MREALEGLRSELEGQRSELESQRSELEGQRSELRRLRELADGQQIVIESTSAEMRTMREDLDGLREHLAGVDAEVGGMREWLQSLDGRLLGTGERVDDAVRAIQAVAADRVRDLEELAGELTAVARRVPDGALLVTPDGLELERFDAGLGGEVVGYRGAGSDHGARVYLDFEDSFRGSEALIRHRQRAYLPLLNGRGRVLDVGCGRGEFLELMRAAGVEASGIDLDVAMVEHCRAKELAAEQADAVTFLRGLPDSSVDAVFAAQVIEHLSYPDLLGFLRLACEKLTPGGILIVETVNPHCPQALKHFWIDPTHQHPLFPEAVLALCRLTGFASAFCWYPQGSGDPDRDRTEQPDYAVIANTGGVDAALIQPPTP